MIVIFIMNNESMIMNHYSFIHILINHIFILIFQNFDNIILFYFVIIYVHIIYVDIIYLFIIYVDIIYVDIIIIYVIFT